MYRYLLFLMVFSSLAYLTSLQAREERGQFQGGGGSQRGAYHPEQSGGGTQQGHSGAAYEAGQSRGYNYGSEQNQGNVQYVPQQQQQTQQQPTQTQPQPYPYTEQPYQPQ